MKKSGLPGNWRRSFRDDAGWRDLGNKKFRENVKAFAKISGKTKIGNFQKSNSLSLTCFTFHIRSCPSPKKLQIWFKHMNTNRAAYHRGQGNDRT
jgi:hypothetical protein